MVEETGTRELPELVRQWLERFRAGDVDGLLELYAPGACINAVSEELRGRQEIARRLRLLGSRLRGLQVRAARPIATNMGLGFETTVGGWLGEARIRHEWELDGQRIRSHVLSIVERRSPAMAGA